MEICDINVDKNGNILDRLSKYMEINNLNNNKVTVAAGLSNGLLGNAFKGSKGLNSDSIEKILYTYSDLNADWLLTGRGDMIIPSNKTSAIIVNNNKGIPLVAEHAVAGFGNSNFAIQEQDVKDYYVIPKFKYCNIDFMIEIHGSSMYPKYNSGDVVACTIIKDSKFIQWNKCHIIATREQGILVKRLKKGEDKDHLLAISDNKNYDPFQIPIKEITGIALVVGVIRLE